MKMNDLYEAPGKRRRYNGPPLEAGGTSMIFTGMGAGLSFLEKKHFQGANTILDYGAGKYARISYVLRDMGYRVYAYDPFNGDAGSDGWTEGASTKLPRNKFDVGFSSFVLNVVPEYTEKEIIAAVSKASRQQFHVTRNMDIYNSVKSGLARQEKTITPFFLNEFATRKEKLALEQGQLSFDGIDETIMQFCEFGTATVRGFQRIPTAEDYSMNLLKGGRGKGAIKIYGA